MKRLSMILFAFLLLLGCTMQLPAEASESFLGTAARSGTFRRPLLEVDGKRYELKASRKLGTVTNMPAQFTAKNLTPGYHVFSVLGTNDQGVVRASDPVMVVVRAGVDSLP